MTITLVVENDLQESTIAKIKDMFGQSVLVERNLGGREDELTLIVNPKLKLQIESERMLIAQAEWFVIGLLYPRQLIQTRME